MDDKTHELAVLKTQAKIRLEELKAQDSAKEVAGKAIGEDGLLYIFLIVLVGVGASLFLDGEKITAYTLSWSTQAASGTSSSPSMATATASFTDITATELSTTVYI